MANSVSMAITESENRIKTILKYAYFSRETEFVTEKKVRKVIDATIERLPDILKMDVRKSLTAFAKKQKEIYIREFGISPMFVLSVLSLMGMRKIAVPKSQAERIIEKSDVFREGKENHIQDFCRDYYKRIKATVKRLCEEEAKDPNDKKACNSMRYTAEMVVREQEHEKNLSDLRSKGVKWVIISSHADCSKRCAPFQGKVFSLDGTSGITDDGRHYVPIETATDIYYTTKSGRVWKNGLFGFNCRHYAIPYQSYRKFPEVSEWERDRKYEAHITQYDLEKQIRDAKLESEMYRGIDNRYADERYTESRMLIKTYKAYTKQEELIVHRKDLKIL